jgi:recombinational DNA repair protein (RecF pathway)
MHRSEETALNDCAICGATLDETAGRAFVVDEDRAVCFDCAVAHGGVYDEQHDHWDRSPAVPDA